MCRYTATFVSLFLLAAFSIDAKADPTCADFGDRDGNCRIDLVDNAGLVECMSGPGVAADPRCVCFDSDSDSDVDLLDYRAFQQAFTGDALLATCDMTLGAYEPAVLNPPPLRDALESLDASGIARDDFDAEGEPAGVYGFSGEAYLTAVDLRIASRGFDFLWSRKYRSKVGTATAMGENWDFGYNIFLEQAGNDLILHDGNSRADRYVRVSDPGGAVWCADDFFREITQEANGTYVCTFPERNVWRFHGFDGTPEAGKLSAIADPNGNTMTFSYDVAGRLVTVVDTLNRAITITYDANDRVASITDFAGRQVTYHYYTSLDTLGGEGDLKSVTSPAVTGTPNGNDFPSGKTTVYTYSTGSPVAELNHNLLTIIDPKGQTYLTFTYAATVNPLDPAFDRVEREVLGDPTDIIDYVYEPAAPTSTNGYAVMRSIVNDRNGHVKERLYDKFNRCVILRELTGSANPASPTTSTVNRPVNKLRATDPDFFETRFEYNSDSLLARVIDPEDSVAEYTYGGDASILTPPRERANMTRLAHIAGPRGGNQTEIVTTIEYDANSNGDTNKKTRLIDGRGNETRFEYDSAGNRTRTTHRIPSIVEDFEYNAYGQLTAHVFPNNGSGHRRRDEVTYYANGPQTGYLKDMIVDAQGLALTTTHEHDQVGNVVRVIDPRGNDSLQTVNQLNQVVRRLSRPVDQNGAIRYQEDYFYDENNNVVRVDVENRDETHTLYPNSTLTTLYEYDILDNLTRETSEVDAGHDVVVEYAYDAERHRVLERSGGATSGGQPTNTLTTVYDERDLVFQEIRAAGDQQQSTTQYDYDGNESVVRTAQGLEGNPNVTMQAYDGFDRKMPLTDAMGNIRMCEYDENGNRIVHRQFGDLVDVSGGAGNVRLEEASMTYDELDRRVRKDVAFFDPATQNVIGDGLSSTATVYSDNSQVVSVTDDDNDTTTIRYDTANRPSVVTDAKGNTAVYGYDENSNVTSVTETEKSDLGLADEVFVTTYSYDRLDRLTSMTDSSGNTTTFGYDSRDNRVLTVDAESHERRYSYDGLDRLLSSTIDLDGDGADGDGTDIVETQAWDDALRVIEQIDENGHSTTYSYDALDRLTLRGHADGTSESFSYDVHDNPITFSSANGSTFTYTYDALDRPTDTSIVVGPGVASDTTFEHFSHDGVSRLVVAQDDDSSVQLAWDSLSNKLYESLAGQTTSSTHDGVGNRLTCQYPSGYQLDYTYDALHRIATIKHNSTTIAGYSYVGPDRVAMQQYGNGARTLYQYDGVQGVANPANDFGVKCVVGVSHTAGASVIDSRTFTSDHVYNNTERRDTRVGGPQLRHAFSYDAAYRLTEAVQEDSGGIPQRDLTYALDGVGNRTSISGFGGVTGAYSLSSLSPPADFQVNQYTQTPRDTRQYDDNGNLTAVVDPVNTVSFSYDAYDRLVARADGLTGDVVQFAYDAFGRRIRKTLVPGVGSPQETRYFYDGRCVIEEQDGAAALQARYVRRGCASHAGVRAQDIVCVERGGQVYYEHADDVGNVMALTDTNGVAFERYEYDDFGEPHVFDGSGTPLASSSVGNPDLFGGYRFDSETRLYLVGDRYLDPQNGRYVTRHEAGMWSDPRSPGNALTYAGGNPWTAVRNDAAMTPTFINATMLARLNMGSGMTRHGGGHHPNIVQFIGAIPVDASGELRFAGAGLAAARGRHRGHVTVLKAHEDAGGGVYRSLQSGNLLMQMGDHAMGTRGRVKFKAGAELSKKVNLAGNGSPGGSSTSVVLAMGRSSGDGRSTGKRGHIVVPRDKPSGRPTGKRIHASSDEGLPTGRRYHKSSISGGGGGSAHNEMGHMAASRPGGGGSGIMRLAGAGGSSHHGGSSRIADSDAICPPCGMRKVVCKNGWKTGETKILPACNNISSR